MSPLWPPWAPTLWRSIPASCPAPASRATTAMSGASSGLT
jgi:hypothetical protein